MAYNNRKDSTIETIGAIGAAISIFCLVQVMIFAKRTNWYLLLLIFTFIIAAVAFVLFFKQKSVYIYLLGVAAVLSVFTTAYAVVNGLLSPLFLILSLLSVTVFLLSFENKYLAYIKEIEAYKKKDFGVES